MEQAESAAVAETGDCLCICADVRITKMSPYSRYWDKDAALVRRDFAMMWYLECGMKWETLARSIEVGSENDAEAHQETIVAQSR